MNRISVRRFMMIFLLVFSVSFLVACNDKKPNPDPDPTIDDSEYHDLSVRDAFGDNGMVASASSYASKVGLDILKSGGNAFDAAVAIAFALNVTEPNASGIGGGGFLVGYDASTGEKVAYNYREFAPGAATRERYLQGDLQLGDGPGSFGIPMLVDGMLTVLENHGTLSREEVIGPSVELAREGFPVSPTLAGVISSNFSKLLRSRSEAMKIYSNNGISPITQGEILVNEDLANVLELIIRDGREGFYQGDLAIAIVQAVQQAGGIVTMEDMQRAMYLTQKSTPISGTYKDYEIVSMTPPSSGGITLVELFNMLEHYGNIGELTHNSPEYLHVVSSALQLSYGDRRKYIADPDFVPVPMQGLMNKDYAALRWAHFNPEVGQTYSGLAEFGDPWAFEPSSQVFYSEVEENAQSHSTTHYTVIDSEGNIVSVTNTINYFFGNGIIPAGTGIHLNNILSPFSTTATSPAVIAPYKRPLSNMSPSIVLKNDQPFAAIGSPGSMRITSAITQVLLNVIEFDMDIQTAIEMPRLFHYVGQNMEIEGAMGTETINGLRALGYNPVVYSGKDLYFGGVHAIVIDQTTGRMHGGADIRRDGKALGY